VTLAKGIRTRLILQMGKIGNKRKLVMRELLMKRWIYVSTALLVACLLQLPSAMGQEGTGTFASGDISPLPPAPSRLDATCVVAVLNRTTQVNHDGTWILPTVPANFGPVRARATCVRSGITLFGQSDLFSIGTNQSVNLPDITLGNTTPIPTVITVNTTTTMLTQAGQTTQLTTMATYSDGSTQNISASSTGTQYRTSNAAIAAISSEGLVTAVSSGTVMIQALNEGGQGILNIQVVIAGANNGGIPNSWIVTNFCPNFSAGTTCPQLTDPAFPSEDPDHDGLTNLQEFQLGTDPNNPDTDGDGLTDGQEVLVYHTNPLLFSTDGTGIPDGIEVQTGTLGGTLAAKLAKALQSLEIRPSTFLLSVNSLSQQASQQLDVIGHLIDGKTTIDLTSTQEGTNYSSSDLTICNFGTPDGNIFAGNVGACTITVTNNGFTATSSGTVSGFSPTALGSVAIPGFANEVAVNGNYAYVAAGSAGLQVVNVTNRSAPAIVGSLALAGNANSVRVVGNFVFVAAGSAGLEVIDVTNPLAPVLRATLNTSGTALDVTVQGNVAYVANSTSLFLVNISTPSVPTALSSLPLTGLIRGVSVDPLREIAVVAADSNGIYVVDVSNLKSPVLVGQLSTIDAHQVAIKGNYAFAADYQNLNTGAPYQNSVASIDISNSAAPTLVSAITNKTFGGVQNDLVLSGNLALGACVSFQPDGVPITDISDPTNLLSRAILSFTQLTEDFGTGIAVDGFYVYVTANGTTFDKFGTTSSAGNHLYIGQYQVLQDTFGIPPVATIVSPTNGATVVQGATIAITVNATDDVAVAAVNLFVNGQPVLTNTVAPYVFYYTVPTNATTLTVSATAVDYGGNIGNSNTVVLNAISDPGTTIVGRVVDGNANPLSGFTVQVVGHTSITAADGTFSIPNVPTVSIGVQGITVLAYGSDNGAVRSGTSATVPVVFGGTTNVGDIVTQARPLIIVDSGNGAVIAVDTSQNPPTTISTIGTPGANAAGVSVTPDDSKAFVSPIFSSVGLRVFDLTKSPPAYLTDININNSNSTLVNFVTSDGRFVLTGYNSTALSIDTTTYKIISSITFPAGAAVNQMAVTPDGRTVILTDAGHNIFRILSLSTTGVLSDTGKTISYNFVGWTSNLAMAPNGHFALMANPSASYISILRIDSQDNVTLGGTTIPISSWPWGIDFTPDGSKAYVTVAGSEDPVNGKPGTVAVLSIDANDNVTDSGVRITIPNGIPFPPDFNGGPSGIAIALDGRAWIGNIAGSITMVDTKTDTVIGTVAVPTPSGIAVPK
jgi:hypothetical protein